MAGAPQPQIFPRKGAAQRHRLGVGNTAKILVVSGGGECGAEQHRRAALGKVLRQKGAGVQAQKNSAHLAAVGRGLEHKVVVKCVGAAQKTAHIKIQLQHRIVCLIRLAVLVQPNFQRAAQLGQGAHKGVGQFLAEHRAVAARFLAGVPPFDKLRVYLVQCVFQAAFALAQNLFGLHKLAFAQRGAVHIAGAAGQIVRLVQQKQVVAPQLKKALQPHHGVKQVVVIPDNHIAPKAQIQSQLKGADAVLLSGGVQRVGRQLRRVQGVPQCVLGAVIVAVGVGTGFGGAVPTGQHTDFILGGQADAVQRQVGVGLAQNVQRVLRRQAGRAARRQIENRAAVAHGFQRGVQNAHRLADACRGLAQKLPALLAGGVYGVHHGALPRTIRGKRKFQQLQSSPAFLPPQRRPLGPRRIAGQQVGDNILQSRRRILVGKIKFQLLVHLVVGQLDAHTRQIVLLRVDGGVDLRLRPMLGELLAGDQLGRLGGGFDLVNGGRAVCVGKNAVGAAFQRVVNAAYRILCPQRDLGFVVGVAFYRRLLQLAVQAGTLQCAVKARKSAVDAAGAQQKFRQLPDGQCQGERFRHQRSSPF